MTDGRSPERLDRIEELIAQMAANTLATQQASNEQLTQFRQEFQQQLQESAASNREQLAQFRQEFQQQLQESAAASDEMWARFEQDRVESNERLTRIEQLVESNNRFLEAFSTKVTRYIETMDNMAQRQNGMIATANQDRQDANTRLGAIQRRVDAIARHLGVDG